MEGHQTRTVNTARAALLAVPDFEPDVVLLDIGLPEMDGYEVARRLRAQNGRHDMRLVAVTGYGQPGDRRRSQAAGFDEHLVKPVEPAALNDFLRRVHAPPPGQCRAEGREYCEAQSSPCAGEATAKAPQAVRVSAGNVHGCASQRPDEPHDPRDPPHMSSRVTAKGSSRRAGW